MILGLHGKMGAGKNEAARRIKTLTDRPVEEVSYAYKLKRSVAELFDFPTPLLETWKNDRDVVVTISRLERGYTRHYHKLTMREFLQRYGTESHRQVFGEDFWLDAALPLDGDYGIDGIIRVVTDVRFPNEKTRIEQLGGEVVRIVGPNEDTGSHASEVPLDCARIIDNTVRDDGFASLDAQLRELLAVGAAVPS